MKLELISLKICPFAQRGVITLKHKGADFTITYIDLSDPPEWFKTISPFGKVPLLKVDDREVLFESAVIDEFLDEITPGSMLPDDPLVRGVDRSWIEFGTACLADLSGLIHAKDAETYDKKWNALKEKLGWLEKQLKTPPYFNGTELSLVDFAYAPLFMRTKLLGIDEALHGEKECPKLTAWAKELAALPAVQESVVPDLPDLLRKHIQAKAPHAAERLNLQ